VKTPIALAENGDRLRVKTMIDFDEIPQDYDEVLHSVINWVCDRVAYGHRW
jgi:hypothetical protein